MLTGIEAPVVLALPAAAADAAAAAAAAAAMAAVVVVVAVIMGGADGQKLLCGTLTQPARSPGPLVASSRMNLPSER